MTQDLLIESSTSPQIALVGTTRAGKSVFTAALAKYLERKRDGVWLSPKGGSPKSTFAQIEEWWTSLQGGNWLPATPPGTLIELQWDLRVHDRKIPLRMFDYAGENLTDLFGGGKDEATGAAKEFFEKVRAAFDSASVLLVLINLESFIERDAATAGEHKGTLISAMSAFLEQLHGSSRSCRVCFVFTAYDQYESVILQKWGGVKNFLEQEVPPLYYEFVDEQSNVAVLPVAAVGETEARVDPHNGKTIRYPKPGFRTKGFGPLVKWLVEAIGDSKVELDAKATESAEDQHNVQFIERLGEEWTVLSTADQLEPIDRFLVVARHGVPYPQRPNAAQLESQRLKLVNAAEDLRAGIVGRIRAERTESFRKLLKIATGLVACLVVGVVGLFSIGSVQEGYATEDCSACTATGKVTCGKCQGAGTQSGSCATCGADGKIGEAWDDGIWEQICPRCDGQRTVTEYCSVCSGTGAVICSICQGAGKVYKHRAGN